MFRSCLIQQHIHLTNVKLWFCYHLGLNVLARKTFSRKFFHIDFIRIQPFLTFSSQIFPFFKQFRQYKRSSRSNRFGTAQKKSIQGKWYDGFVLEWNFSFKLKQKLYELSAKFGRFDKNPINTKLLVHKLKFLSTDIILADPVTDRSENTFNQWS